MGSRAYRRPPPRGAVCILQGGWKALAVFGFRVIYTAILFNVHVPNKDTYWVDQSLRKHHVSMGHSMKLEIKFRLMIRSAE